MSEQEPCRLLPEVVRIAERAGEAIMTVYEGGIAVSDKADGSPLTEADRRAHRLILDRLQALEPDTPVLSEESAPEEYANRRGWRRFWLVDPLDGTKEFIKRNGEFTVNIALMEADRPVLGVVRAPALGVQYYACRGQGAWKQEDGREPETIHVRRYAGGAPVVVASRSHAGDKLGVFLQRLGQAAGEPVLTSMGSSLKLCLVAEGAADIYPRLVPTSEWDTAAAQCIVETAGGRVLTLDGRPLAYNKPTLLNPCFIVVGEGDFDWLALVPHDD